MANATGMQVLVVDSGLVAVPDRRITGSITSDWVTTQAAYTQTYSTAARTVPAATAVAVATTAATNSSPYGYAQAQADAIPVAINANAADILAVKKVVNALIDDMQALGFSQ